MPKLNRTPVLFLTALAIITAITLVVNPIRLINEVKDTTRKQEVNTIYEALEAYVEENDGSHPTHNNGSALPTVLNENIYEKGVDASKLDKIDKYLNKLPQGPDGDEYKVGLSATGNILVATKLSDGSVFVK